ncbi:MAG: response regulator [Planctomycetota bacterium]
MSKILLVEDDKNQALLYEQELEAEGYEVEVADNGREACEMVESVDPDIVVMDISMPGMDGIEAMGRMLSKHNKLPVILNTAYSSYKDNFLSWSADAYVIKSSDLSDLKDTIEKLLKSSKASEEETE